jgi:hypothetical protein
VTRFPSREKVAGDGAAGSEQPTTRTVRNPEHRAMKRKHPEALDIRVRGQTAELSGELLERLERISAASGLSVEALFLACLRVELVGFEQDGHLQ